MASGEIDGQEIIKRLQELKEHGYGRLEVVVRNHEVSAIQWQKTVVRGNGRPG